MSKNFFVATMLLAFSYSSVGQTSVAIAPDKMNVLYIGIDNPVSIAAYGTTEDKVAVSINGGGGSMSKLNAGTYVVRVSQITDDCTIQVDVDGKTAGASKFRVRTLPDPSGTIGGFVSGSNVPAKSFQAQAGVGVYVRDFPIELRYQVIGFTFTVDDGKGGIIKVDCEGNSFSSEAKQHIAQYVLPGKTVTIDNILVQNPNGSKAKIPSLVYNIK